MFVGPPSVDVNATCRPSGDQIGRALPLELSVKREAVPRARSYIQMSESPVSGFRTSVATELPSGEIAGRPNDAGRPTVPRSLPDRSIQVSCEVPAPPTESAGT